MIRAFDPQKKPSLLGRVAYRTLHKPRSVVRRLMDRGVFRSLGDVWHHREMRTAATRLAPVASVSGIPCHEVHFLTGKRFWHQTLFCAWSLSRTAGIEVVPVLYNDGTLRKKDVRRVQFVLPRTRVIDEVECNKRIEQLLPRASFPHLRARRDVYPNLRKVIDVHVGQYGWKIVLDSDMLFFRRPDALLDWLKSPGRPCHMIDVETSYGYPLDFLSRQCGCSIKERVNVGVTGLKSEEIDWVALEAWACEQNMSFGPSYFQEQALIAQLMARHDCLALSEREYWVLPPDPEVRSPTAVLHHYVSHSKPAYYRYGWRAAYNSGIEAGNRELR